MEKETLVNEHSYARKGYPINKNDLLTFPTNQDRINKKNQKKQMRKEEKKRQLDDFMKLAEKYNLYDTIIKYIQERIDSDKYNGVIWLNIFTVIKGNCKLSQLFRLYQTVYNCDLISYHDISIRILKYIETINGVQSVQRQILNILCYKITFDDRDQYRKNRHCCVIS